MNPTDIIFQTVSNLTGGLIVDIQTAIIGLVTIGFILMGLDYLKDLLLSTYEGTTVKDSELDSFMAEENLRNEYRSRGFSESEVDMKVSEDRTSVFRSRYKKTI